MYKKQITIVFALLVVGLLLTQTPALAQDNTIGVVDLDLVINSHPDLPAMQQEYAQNADALQAELDELPEEEQQQVLMQYQQVLMQLESELEEKLYNSIVDVVTEIAKELDLVAVVNKNLVLFGGLDLTEQVIEQLQANAE